MESVRKTIPLNVVPRLPEVNTCPICKRSVQRDEEAKRISCAHCGIVADPEVNVMHALTNRWNSLPRQNVTLTDILAITAIAFCLLFFSLKLLIKTEIVHETKGSGFCITKNYCLS